MPAKTFGPWKGVDARSLLDAQDSRTLRAAVNVDLTTDGCLQERDGLRAVAELSAYSVGLYSVGGSLRTVIPAGHSLPASTLGVVPVLYDAIGDGTVYSYGTISRISSVSSWGADAAVGIYPYIVVQRSTGEYEHHWIKDTPIPDVNGAPPPAYIPSNDPVSTKVTLPFTPGESVLKIQEKMCAIDNVSGAVRFCSTTFGVEDWGSENSLGDAGYLPVIRHATGDRTIKGLAFYDSLMAVCFQDSIQLWQMHPDPARMSLVRVLGGPGVQYPGSLANVRGDLYYFSRGTFSSLRTVGTTGQLVTGDIGAPIAPLTKLLTETTPIGLWSESRSAYYCAFGTTVWRYVTSPSSKVYGWTSYELPSTPTAMVEHLGEIYIRAGDTVYRFERGVADGSTWRVDMAFYDAGSHEWKTWQSCDLVQQGTAQVLGATDTRDPSTYTEYFHLDGVNESLVDLWIGDNGPALSLRFTGTVGAGGADNFWALDSFTVFHTVGDRGR